MEKNFSQFLKIICIGGLFYLGITVWFQSPESTVFAKDIERSARLKAVPPQKQNTKKGDQPVPVKQESVETFLQVLEFYGRVEKPQTVFIIPGKDPKVDDITIERKFFKEIFRIVEKNTLRTPQSGDAVIPYIPY